MHARCNGINGLSRYCLAEISIFRPTTTGAMVKDRPESDSVRFLFPPKIAWDKRHVVKRREFSGFMIGGINRVKSAKFQIDIKRYVNFELRLNMPSLASKRCRCCLGPSMAWGSMIGGINRV